MELADLNRPVSGLRHELGKRKGSHRGKALKFMKGMGVAVLPVEVIMEPGEDHRSRCRTGSGGGKGVGEGSGIARKGVEVRGLDHPVSVASGNR